jgi:hypothetical protein
MILDAQGIADASRGHRGIVWVGMVLKPGDGKGEYLQFVRSSVVLFCP